MNKAILKSYFCSVKDNYKDKLVNKAFKNDKGYLIADKYSIVYLNELYHSLELSSEDFGIKKIYDNFSNYNLQSIDITNDTIDLKDDFRFNDNYKCDTKDNVSNYGINYKLFNKIKKLIKADKVYLKTGFNGFDYAYIIYLENTKTNEHAYLLPVRYF